MKEHFVRERDEAKKGRKRRREQIIERKKERNVE